MSNKLSQPEAVETPRLPESKTVFGYPRDFLDNRFVYITLSPRAHGLSVGINMNPDRFCNFDCVYCEVDRQTPSKEKKLDVPAMAAELEKTLRLVGSGQLRTNPRYSRLSNDLLQLRHVALSGDGEPTLSLDFAEALQAVIHVRTRKSHPFFKVVLLTNGTWLDLPAVRDSLSLFTGEDEIWIKLDAGTQAYMDRINKSEISLEKVLQNTLAIGKRRSIIIQSLFPMIGGQEPPPEEIDQYIRRLNELKEGGARISLVQIYSATRPMAQPNCGHLPLSSLSLISRRIRVETGLKTEVF